MKDFYNIAIKAAVAAGHAILEVYNSDDFQVSEKDDKSPLTKADKAAHQVIVSHLKKTGIPVLSEEGKNIPFEERSRWNRFWLVDPLDGTKEFIKRNGEFTVNIALIAVGQPVFGVVYAPVLEKLYLGLPGQGAWLSDHPDGKVTLENVKAYGTVLPIARTARPGIDSPVTGTDLQSSGTARSNTGTTPQYTDTTSPDTKSAGLSASPYRVVASRSHLNPETAEYLEQIRAAEGEIEIVSKGSSLKLCMVAAGEADVYPRLGPTMEWDVAAAHAVVSGAGKHLFILKKGEKEEGKWEKDGELRYNKENLLNPYFLTT